MSIHESSDLKVRNDGDKTGRLIKEKERQEGLLKLEDDEYIM